jgi:tight adherence protein C
MLWLGGLRTNLAESRLDRLAARPRTASLEAPFGQRVMIPVIDGIVSAVMRMMPHSLVAETARKLVTAGRPMSTQAFFTLWLVTAVGLPGAMLALLTLTDAPLNFLTTVILLASAFFGSILPFYWLRNRVNRRKLAIWKRLPDAFDLITVSVEAGLGLDAALRHVAEKLRGPLADEIAQMLREVGMGRPRREALEDMAARCDVPEVTTFVNAVIQAEQLGTSLGRVLRAQALSLRVKRRQRAQEIARKAPVKMVFPLVLFIMPTFFIVTVGPVVVHLITFLNE